MGSNMESIWSANDIDMQSMVSSFLEIAVGQTPETAFHFLQAASWNLEDAIQLFYVGNEAQVRPRLPVVRDRLYDDAMFCGNFDAGTLRTPAVWESDQGASSTTGDDLASLYRPPFHLMFNGSFEEAKDAASLQDMWLLVNLQSRREFSSHMLNRDTWANEIVSQTIRANFIFWQVYDDTIEGRKVCNYYKLDSDSIPVVLVIDPITGQKMLLLSGMVEPENLLENLVPFMDCCPRNWKYATLSHETIVKKPPYPHLPEEPVCDRNLLCRVCVRLPDGRRMQRNFLRTDPIQLLWSFCFSLLVELESEEAETRPFRLTQAIPGASKCLDYGSNLTFQESGLANSMITVTWD